LRRFLLQLRTSERPTPIRAASASGRINGKVFITVVGYQLGGTNSKHGLRGLAPQTQAEFDLTGTID